MKPHDPNEDVHFDKQEVYSETSNGTFEALRPYLRNPERDKDEILELLKLDYRLIYLLTRRYSMK